MKRPEKKKYVLDPSREILIAKLKKKECNLTQNEKEYILKTFIAIDCFIEEETERYIKYGR